MKSLKAIWKNLASGYTNNFEIIDALWTELEKSYTTKNRYYHNLNHLEYMLDKAFRYQEKLGDQDTVLFSIFYHDIVYDTKRRDNEQESADIAQDRLTKLSIPTDKIAKCQIQIIATKYHECKGDNDTKYLLDFDLAILGDTPENYENYTKKIRKEYSIFPDFLYKRGRKKVLQHFLNMNSIFKTPEFIEKYETQARKNLTTELQKL